MGERKAFLLRISPELYDELSRWAADELRSLNGQIEYLLRRSLAQAGRHQEGRSRGGGKETGGRGT